MIKETHCTLTWHDGKEIPNPSNGSFIILNNQGWIAEAEYNETRGYWMQYRWSTILSPNQVLAWCRISDIIIPEE